METAKGVYSAASKMVFGDNADAQAHNTTAGQEPQSGVTGEGTTDKPYDGGNATGTYLSRSSPARIFL